MKRVIIQGRQSTRDRWGTVSAMTGDNAAAQAAEDIEALEAVAEDKLAQWNIAAADIRGAFPDWQFRISRE